MASQVRVLPPPPAFARFAGFGSAGPHRELRAKRAKVVALKPEGRRRTAPAGGTAAQTLLPTKISKTTPCKVARGRPARMLLRDARRAFREARSRHPFAIQAIVVLPDRPRAIWTLPEGGADFPCAGAWSSRDLTLKQRPAMSRQMVRISANGSKRAKVMGFAKGPNPILRTTGELHRVPRIAPVSHGIWIA